MDYTIRVNGCWSGGGCIAVATKTGELTGGHDHRHNSERQQGLSNADEIRTLEEKLLQPDFRRNRDAVAALLADDFREFGSSGCVWTRQQILDHLESEAPFEAVMQDFETTELTEGVVLTTYKVTVKNRTSLRSSIWIKRDDRWQILFHQGTITRSWLDYLKTRAMASQEAMENTKNG